MAAISNYVVADATPTNQTLYPLTASLPSSRWTARSAATVAGNRTLEIKCSLATARRATDRFTVLYARPAEVTDTNGAVSVSGIQRFAGEFVIPVNSLNADRNHFAHEVASVVANAVLKAIIKDRDVPS